MSDQLASLPKPLGMWHVALNVVDLEACERFYVDLLGFKVEWRPSDDSVYLCSGRDNLALHRASGERAGSLEQRLDHIGIFLAGIDDVDPWFEFLNEQGVEMVTQPRTHRDGARSFYCLDPSGNKVQIIFHPPITP